MSFTKIRTGNILSGSVASGSLGNAAITGFPASSAADDSDLLLIYDDSEEGLRKQSRSNFLGTIEPVELPTASIAFGQIDGAGVDGDTSLQYLTVDILVYMIEEKTCPLPLPKRIDMINA